jgi:CheY-like chemotaxis protein
MARRGASEKLPLNINTIIMEYLNSPSYKKMVIDREFIHLDRRLAPDLMNVSGSPSDLSKIVMNLVINGYEASTGPGTILIRTFNEYIDAHRAGMTDIPEGEYVHLQVRDNGIGIDAEHLPRIFEPFYSNKKLGSSGTGLGLAVVWGTVKDHGGIIDVKSSKGQGTTFDIYFPVCREQIEITAPEIPISSLKGHGEKILVVDDIAMQREIAMVMLEKLNYEPTAVESGEEAVEYLKKQTFDLIVLDMIMGEGMDGLDTYQRIIRQCPGQKAVIASGYSETDRVREAQHLGAGAYIKKPFSIHTLGLAIQRELAQSD